MTFDPVTIGAIVGAIAYGAASGVFKAVAEHRRAIGGNLGPRVEDAQWRIARLEGILGIKRERDTTEDVTPTLRPPFNRND